MTPRALLAAPLLALLVLAGCSAGGNEPGPGTVEVVAVTDVWGDVAKQIGGEHVEVTSLISGTAQDPHSFEATAKDQLALKRAGLVIVNGGGYDDFMGTLVEASGTAAKVLDAVELSGLPDAGEEGFNEHVFYDLGSVGSVARAVADALSAADPQDAAEFRSRLTAFTGKLDELQDRAARIAQTANGAEAIVTEPVPGYLLAACGIGDATPSDFSEAIEEGTDVPPALLDQVVRLVQGGTVALLAVNSQTSGPESEKVVAAAEQAKVPVVGFTETLPDGRDYLSWMAANLDAIEHALR